MLRTDGGYGVPGMPGNGAVAGGISLRDLFPNAPSDVGVPMRTPGIVRPGSKQLLKDIFPPRQGVPNLPSDHPLHDFVRRGFTGDLVQNPPFPGSSPYSELPKDYLEQRNPFGAPPAPTQQPGQPAAPVQLELPLAGNPFGPGFVIPGKTPVRQPVLPGENKEAIEGVYGTPGPKQMPGSAPLGLPMAMGSSNLPNALPGAPGNAAGMLMAQLPGGEQGPAQGPNTPIKFYPGLGYAPYVQRG